MLMARGLQCLHSPILANLPTDGIRTYRLQICFQLALLAIIAHRGWTSLVTILPVPKGIVLLHCSSYWNKTLQVVTKIYTASFIEYKCQHMNTKKIIWVLHVMPCHSHHLNLCLILRVLIESWKNPLNNGITRSSLNSLYHHLLM